MGEPRAIWGPVPRFGGGVPRPFAHQRPAKGAQGRILAGHATDAGCLAGLPRCEGVQGDGKSVLWPVDSNRVLVCTRMGTRSSRPVLVRAREGTLSVLPMMKHLGVGILSLRRMLVHTEEGGLSLRPLR